MKHSLSLALVLLAAPGAYAASVPPVVPPVRRAETLATAKALLAPRELAALENVPNPFFSEAFTGRGDASLAFASALDTGASAEAARPVGPRGPRELLAAIADGLKPSGYIVMGGQASLSFGQKRVKAGDSLTITFEDNSYTLEIVSIDRTHFTVRLGNETYTRPIK